MTQLRVTEYTKLSVTEKMRDNNRTHQTVHNIIDYK